MWKEKLVEATYIRKEYVYGFIMAISCILLQYDAAVSTVGAWALVLCYLGESIHYKRIPIDIGTTRILFIIVIQELISLCYYGSDFSIFWKQIGNIVFIIMIFSFGILFTDLDTFYKCYKIVGFICTAVVLIQTAYMVITKNTI